MAHSLPLPPLPPRSDGELKEGEGLCILGGTAQLGNWQLGEVLTMTALTPSTWEAEVRDAGQRQPGLGQQRPWEAVLAAWFVAGAVPATPPTHWGVPRPAVLRRRCACR